MLFRSGIVEVTNGVLTYKKIIHRPKIVLHRDATAKEISRAQRLAERAESSCMISRAVKGNVEIELEIDIQVASE